MFTITLQVWTYDKAAVVNQLRNYITRKGWGKASVPKMVQDQRDYFKYEMDVIVKEIDSMIYEFESMACGVIDIPSELGSVDFHTLGYAVVSIPVNMSSYDMMSLCNHIMKNMTTQRATVINTLARVQHLESIVLDEEDLAPREIEEDPLNIDYQEGKTKWLH